MAYLLRIDFSIQLGLVSTPRDIRAIRINEFFYLSFKGTKEFLRVKIGNFVIIGIIENLAFRGNIGIFLALGAT